MVTFYNYGGNSTLTYQLLLNWDPAYQGLITLDLIPPSRSVSCSSLLAKLMQLAAWQAINTCKLDALDVACPQGKCCLRAGPALQQICAELPRTLAC